MTAFVVFGRVAAIRKGLLNGDPMIKLNTGHVITAPDGVISNDTILNCDTNLSIIEVGKAYFMSCHQDGHKQAFDKGKGLYLLDLNECTETDEVIRINREMHAAAKAAVDGLKALNRHDRGIVLGATGILVSSAIGIVSGISTIGQVASWITGGPISPIGLAVSAGTTVVSTVAAAMQYENLSEQLDSRIDTVKRFQQTHEVYARLMRKYIPTTGLNGIPLNVSVTSLVGVLREVFQYSETIYYNFWNCNYTVKTEFVN